MAYLREHTNAEIKLLLLPIALGTKFSDHVVEQVVQECSGFDIVGFSFPSNLYLHSNQLSEAIKTKIGAKIVYGGIHPTVCPQQCLRYADAVCVGEGEEAMTELVNRYEEERIIASDIKNMYVKDKVGNVVSNAPRPLITNLDKIPSFHFWQTKEKIFHNGFFRDATVKIYEFYMEPSYTYMTLATLGCVFHCTFCCNERLRQIYKGQKLFRKRNLDSLFAELHHVKSALPFIKSISLNDDLFFALKMDDMKAFCSRYKKEVNMPLIIYGGHPSLITAEKIKLVADAGLVKLRMGIQSGCPETLGLYGRPTKMEQIVEAANILHKHAKGVQIDYDFILDNPFEKDEDVEATLKFIGKLQKPFALNLFSMTFYPGTSLYDMAIEKDLISSEEDITQEAFKKNYLSPNPGYYNGLFKIISSFKIPNKIWDILVERKSGYRVWYKLLSFGTKFAITPEMFVKGIKSISKGHFRKVFRYLVANPDFRKYKD